MELYHYSSRLQAKRLVPSVVTHSDFPALGEPLADVVQRVQRALLPYRHRLLVVGAEELMARVRRRRVPPVLA